MKLLPFLFSLSCFLASTMSLANVLITTEPAEVYVQMPGQNAGVITFTVTGNDYFYPDPSGTQTLYTRIRLALNAQHQVSQIGWPGYDPAQRQDPVYLPLELINAPSGSQLVAPSDSVAIVRWLETENEIWFQIKHPTTTWIQTPQGDLVAPSAENGYVRYKIGLSSMDSHNTYYPLFLTGHANLPGATRDLNWVTNPQDPFFCDSPEWLLNLENSLLSACPDPDCELVFDLIGFRDSAYDGPYGLFTSPIGGPLDKGSCSTVNFMGEDLLAMGSLMSNVPLYSGWGLVLFIILMAAMGLIMIKKSPS